MKCLLFWCFFVFASSLWGQGLLDGSWSGYLTQEEGGYRSRYFFQLTLKQDGVEVKGISFAGVEQIFAEVELEGTFNGAVFRFKETNFIQASVVENLYWCTKEAQLVLSRDEEGAWILSGRWWGDSKAGPCIPGEVYLKKIPPQA